MIGKLITRTLTDHRYDTKFKKVVLEPDMATSHGHPIGLPPGSCCGALSLTGRRSGFW
jgi:hypothetical protein